MKSSGSSSRAASLLNGSDSLTGKTAALQGCGGVGYHLAKIYDTILRVFEIAREEGIPSYRAADRLAEQRIAEVAKVRRTVV